VLFITQDLKFVCVIEWRKSRTLDGLSD